MKKTSKLMLLSFIIAAASVLAVAVNYASLPAKIPMQWGFNGQVRYDEKWQLWIVTGLCPLMAVLFRFLPVIDPGKNNYAKFQGSYDLLCLIMQLFMFSLICCILVESYRPGTIDVRIFVTLLVGLLFVILGNMMPKFRHNYFCGIRTPWALASEDAWRYTQRVGGRIFFAIGLLTMASALLEEKISMAIMLGSLVIGIALTTFLSWKYYTKICK